MINGYGPTENTTVYLLLRHHAGYVDRRHRPDRQSD